MLTLLLVEDDMEKLLEMARTAGRTGQSYNEFCASDEVQALVDEMGSGRDRRLDTTALEKSFQEGLLEWRLAGGWVTLWTTAPIDYDTFGTTEAEACGDYRGKALRRVIADPRHAGYQADRYGSGLHPAWKEDPREADRRYEEKVAKEKAEREAHEAKRALGLEWLSTAGDASIEETDEAYDAAHARGLTSFDLRAERARRETAAVDAVKAAEWARCRAAIPEGATLVDEGTKGERGVYGWIKGIEPHVYPSVTLREGWPADDADRGTVVGSDGEVAGSPSLVADQIASGRVRVARPDEVFPPKVVVLRLGGWGSLRDIRRADVGGKRVWVGRPTYGETLVLDDAGHLVRSKKIVAAAIAACSA